MLVLSRKEGESIVVGNGGVVIEVAKITGNRVKIVIKAPDDVRILRGELTPQAEPPATAG